MRSSADVGWSGRYRGRSGRRSRRVWMLSVGVLLAGMLGNGACDGVPFGAGTPAGGSRSERGLARDAQTRAIRGRVVDEDGDAVPGVAVRAVARTGDNGVAEDARSAQRPVLDQDVRPSNWPSPLDPSWGVSPPCLVLARTVTDREGRYALHVPVWPAAYASASGPHCKQGFTPIQGSAASLHVEAAYAEHLVYPMRMTTEVSVDRRIDGIDFRTLDWGELDPLPLTGISTIQGAAHRSPLDGAEVENVVGVVTAVRDGRGGPPGSAEFRSYQDVYIQSPFPDGNRATSEGIMLYLCSEAELIPGDLVLVKRGTLREDYTDPPFYTDAWTGNLSRTRLLISSGSDSLKLLRRTRPGPRDAAKLPPPVSLGSGGRAVPEAVLYADISYRDVEHPNSVFQPKRDVLDFWESLEHMRVRLGTAVVTGPTDAYGNFFVALDSILQGRLRSPAGGIVREDYDPTRGVLRVAADSEWPSFSVGDRVSAPIIGILDYERGAYTIRPEMEPPAEPAPAARRAETQTEIETEAPAQAETEAGAWNGTVDIPEPEDGFSIAALNVHDLAYPDPQRRFDQTARTIVVDLNAPDIVSLVEIMDNWGTERTDSSAADRTLSKLLDAVHALPGGAHYDYRQIDPAPHEDGGAPYGNVRNVFLFDTERVEFVDRGAGGAWDATQPGVEVPTGAVRLSHSPGRIRPRAEAFERSRKPLAGEFRIGGETVIVISVHFRAKIGDTPVMGRIQPPDRSYTEQERRHPQARHVRDFVASILELDPEASVIVAGDYNDFHFSETAEIIEAGGLIGLHGLVDPERRYTYNYMGRSQVLDQIHAAESMLEQFEVWFDVMHVNSDLPVGDVNRHSDHDPVLAVFRRR